MKYKLAIYLAWMISCIFTNIANAGIFFATDDEAECIIRVKNNPKYDILKVNFRMEASNFIRYSNQLFISDDEKNILPSYLDAIDDCVKAYRSDNERNLDPIIFSIFKNAYNFYLEQAARLYNHEINYGEFNKIMDKEFSEQEAAKNQRNDEVEQANNDSNAAFGRQSMDGVRQIERAFNPPPQRTTNCYAYGNTVRCR